MRATRFVCVVLVLCAGCMVQNPKEKLTTSLRQYNVAVRWGAVEWASEHVAPEKKSELLPRQQEFGDISITQCKIGAVKLKGKQHALAMVRVDWYTNRSLRLKTSFIEQNWKMRDGKWLITAQRLVRGPPCPLFTAKAGDRQMWPKFTNQEG